jgi:hypothetical protein
MPLHKCLNVPPGHRPCYFKGTERTPLGLGLSPRYEQLGSEHLGLDGRMYMVGYAGVNTKRWVYVHWRESRMNLE